MTTFPTAAGCDCVRKTNQHQMAVGTLSRTTEPPNTMNAPTITDIQTAHHLVNIPLLCSTKFIPPRLGCTECRHSNYGDFSCTESNAGHYCDNCGASLENAPKRWGNQTDSGQNRLGPSEHRKADRARTYPGIARAMAEQWAPIIRHGLSALL